MSIEEEVAALRSLARRLSETRPAEQRAARWEAERDNTLDDRARMRSPHVEAGGYWQHRRSTHHRPWSGPEWRGDRRAERAREQRDAPLNITALLQPWMPSITGIGPIALRWAPTVERDEPEEWRTYEAIKAGCSLSLLHQGGVLLEKWLRTVPSGWMTVVATHLAAVAETMSPTSDQDLEAYVRALADRLAPQPRIVPAAVKHIGALPRDWKARRAQRRVRDALSMATYVPESEPRSNRSALGTFAARYTPRRPDGSYNRHDARRWMRRFRAVALIASDALEQSCDRLTAIRTLCEAVGLEDALRLTERPGARRIASSDQPGWSDTVNEVVVTFSDRGEAVTHQDEEGRMLGAMPQTRIR